VQPTDLQLDQVKAAAQQGCTEAMIARIVFQCDPATFRRLKHRDEKVLRALEAGQGPVQIQVSKALVNKAKAGDVSAIKYLEATRYGVRMPPMELTGPGGGPVPTDEYSGLSREARRARLRELTRRGMAVMA
jgi:hypothetical protein